MFSSTVRMICPRLFYLSLVTLEYLSKQAMFLQLVVRYIGQEDFFSHMI